MSGSGCFVPVLPRAMPDLHNYSSNRACVDHTHRSSLVDMHFGHEPAEVQRACFQLRLWRLRKRGFLLANQFAGPSYLLLRGKITWVDLCNALNSTSASCSFETSRRAAPFGYVLTTHKAVSLNRRLDILGHQASSCGQA